MAEYIEREALIKDLKLLARYEDSFRQSVILGVVHTIECKPVADVAPVVHGRWKLHNNGNATCGVCHCISVHVWDFDSSLSYCPHCGAKMDGDLSG